MMYFFIILGIVIIGAFTRSLMKDKNELENQSVEEKFKILIYDLNKKIYDGEGKIHVHNKRGFNLYKKPSNEILQFFYSSGALTIKWSYKYFQKELVETFVLDKARNLSSFEQLNFSEDTYNKMVKIKARFKSNILLNTDKVDYFQKEQGRDDNLKKYQPRQLKNDELNKFKLDELTTALEDRIVDALRINKDDNPMKGSPLESLFYIEIMNDTKEEFKVHLSSPEYSSFLSDDDIQVICTRAYQSVYDKLFESEDTSLTDELNKPNHLSISVKNSSSDEDRRKIIQLFYKFCFDNTITNIFLGDLERSSNLHKAMLECTTVDKAMTLNFFKSFINQFNEEIQEKNYPQFVFKNYSFQLRVQRIIFGDKGDYLEILSNDFENITSENNLALAIANDYIIYGKEGKPKSIYVVVKDPYIEKYALRKVNNFGINSRVAFLENNQLDTIEKAIVQNIQSSISTDDLPF